MRGTSLPIWAWPLFLLVLTLVQGGSIILNELYDGSLPKALQQIFPDIGLNEKLFNALPGTSFTAFDVESNAFEGRYWRNPAHRREFFEKIAKDEAFDPLIPSNWYMFSNDKIRSYQVLHMRSHMHVRFL